MEVVHAKVVVLGSQGVGKTSLVTRYETRTFSNNTSSTIGAAYSHIRMNAHGCSVNMQIWDTAGQEKFRSLGPMYYRNANAGVLVFDLTSRSSFIDLQSWTRDLKASVSSQLVLVLLGNKLDLTDKRAVSRSEALKFADEVEGVYFETSALSNDGVEAAFEHIGLILAKQMIENTKRGEFNENILESTIDLTYEIEKKKSKCC